MWNKPQQSDPSSDSPPETASIGREVHASQKDPGGAVLGPSIKIKGDLSGEEDLLIEGQVEGQVTFKNHTVTIGGTGRVRADVSCKTIIVDGHVQGNLYGEELVVIRKSSNVQGNAVASRVHLEDGAIFRGSIDMQPKQEEPTKAASIARKVRQVNATLESRKTTPESPKQDSVGSR